MSPSERSVVSRPLDGTGSFFRQWRTGGRVNGCLTRRPKRQHPRQGLRRLALSLCSHLRVLQKTAVAIFVRLFSTTAQSSALFFLGNPSASALSEGQVAPIPIRNCRAAAGAIPG